ncbi:protein of unknown function [Streptococcus thermophilus]|nr:type ISP restriction/modification enzyme [Streptococcus thermophilus]CAD0118830.1 protein of unknown function [Streptococcus thermophilus]
MSSKEVPACLARVAPVCLNLCGVECLHIIIDSIDSIQKSKEIQFVKDKIVKSLYRPFTKKSLYYDNDVIERPGQWYKKFGEENLVIMTTGKGISREFSALVTNVMPNLHAMDTGQHSCDMTTK